MTDTLFKFIIYCKAFRESTHLQTIYNIVCIVGKI